MAKIYFSPEGPTTNQHWDASVRTNKCNNRAVLAVGSSINTEYKYSEGELQNIRNMFPMIPIVCPISEGWNMPNRVDAIYPKTEAS